MKKINITLIYIAMVLITSNISFSSCEKSLVQIWPYGFGDYNSDKVFLDTCKDSPTFGEWYQQGTWVITFRNNIFKDTNKPGNEFDLNNIDSSNFPDLFAALCDMEKKFGKITFSRENDNNGFNYSFSNELTVDIRFEKIIRSRDILYSLATLPGSRNFWYKRNNKNYNSGC